MAVEFRQLFVSEPHRPARQGAIDEPLLRAARLFYGHWGDKSIKEHLQIGLDDPRRVRLFIEWGVPVNWRKDLRVCVRCNHIHTLEMLLYNASVHVGYSELVLLLELAYSFGHEQCAKILLEKDIRIAASMTARPPWVSMYLEARSNALQASNSVLNALCLRGMDKNVAVLNARQVWKTRRRQEEVWRIRSNEWCTIL